SGGKGSLDRRLAAGWTKRAQAGAVGTNREDPFLWNLEARRRKDGVARAQLEEDRPSVRADAETLDGSHRHRRRTKAVLPIEPAETDVGHRPDADEFHHRDRRAVAAFDLETLLHRPLAPGHATLRHHVRERAHSGAARATARHRAAGVAARLARE